MVTFDQLMQGFGVVTVMNACIYQPINSYTGNFQCCTVGGAPVSGSGAVLTKNDFVYSGESLDTLKIANITQEGPTKTITGGQYANPLIKYGKTATMEMQDALGRASTLVRFFGCTTDSVTYKQSVPVGFSGLTGDGVSETFDIFVGAAVNNTAMTTVGNYAISGLTGITLVSAVYKAENKSITLTLSDAPDDEVSFGGTFTNPGLDFATAGTRLSVTDKFPGAFAIEGTTFFIDQKTGEKKTVYIFIPQFLPDAILTLTQDAEGDATVFDLNGSVNVTDIADTEGGESRSVFYEIRNNSFFQA